MVSLTPFRSAALVLASCALANLSSASFPSIRDYDNNDYYVVHLDSSSSPTDLATHLGLKHHGPLEAVGPDHYIFSGPKHSNNVLDDAIQDLKLRRRKRDPESLSFHVLDTVRFEQKQTLKQRLVKRSVVPPPPPVPVKSARAGSIFDRVADTFDYAGALGIRDPIFPDQWHLHNTINTGNDLNVTGVWAQGITGTNSTVCIIDDGLDFKSNDLAQNYFAKGSWDFNDPGPDPLPRLSDDRHGTRCAGEVAAVKNNVCGVGVAYDAKVSAVRILSKPITDVDEAESVVYGLKYNDIYSCSWGPPDDGKTMDGPGILIRRAILRAIQQGRDGKGTIYVFAAGNGAAHDDNCNFDGYTNSIYSITVGAIDKMNQHPYYSEKCSAQLVVTYSSGSGDAIHTTDVGANECTKAHGGTSAAGPLAAGVMALVLEARPDLTWRDAQWITVLTAVPFYAASKPADWQKTPLGLQYHHQYGYGKVDAYAMVEMAKTWELVNKQGWYMSPWIPVYQNIPEGDDGVTSTFKITPEMLKNANLKRVEHVTVTMTVHHSRRGDISVDLRSPANIVSHLSTDRDRDDAMTGYTDWTFMSVVHWGEDGAGDWKLTVRDTHPNEFNGSFSNWKIKLWGEAIDNDKQGMHPLPELMDDVAPDQNHIPPIVPPGSDSDETTTEKPSPTSTVAPSASSTPSDAVPTKGAEADQDEAHNGFLPNPFPHFSLGKGAKVWVYGALALIGAFVVGVAGYFFIVHRRKRKVSDGLDHEFSILPHRDDMDTDDEDAEAGGAYRDRDGPGNGVKRGNPGSRSGPARPAGELYNPFAGVSDDEDEDDDGSVAGKNPESVPLRSGNAGTGVGGPSSPLSSSSSPSSRQGRMYEDASDDERQLTDQSGVLVSPTMRD